MAGSCDAQVGRKFTVSLNFQNTDYRTFLRGRLG